MSIEKTESGAVIFDGATGVAIYQALAIKHALSLYARTGMKANRAYTPSAMLRTASAITGKRFKARDYDGAIKALQEWLDAAKAARDAQAAQS